MKSYPLVFSLLCLSLLCSSASFGAGKPSWQTFGMFIEGISSPEEEDRIERAIEAFDTIVFGGLGLPMSYPGHKGQGGMTKDPILKETQFRKAGKKEKASDPKRMAVYKKLFPAN